MIIYDMSRTLLNDTDHKYVNDLNVLLKSLLRSHLSLFSKVIVRAVCSAADRVRGSNE